MKIEPNRNPYADLSLDELYAVVCAFAANEGGN